MSADGPSSLHHSVLVLNRCYMAVQVVGLRRAICLLFRDLAEIVHHEDGQYANYDFESWLTYSELMADADGDKGEWIRSVNFAFRVPRVVRLLEYDRIPKRTLRFSRRNIFARDNHCCMYCGSRFPLSELSLDHVMPRSRGGPTSWENVVSSCVRCNVRKGGRTPQEARMKLVNEPVRPKRSPLLGVKLSNPKYSSWKPWLESSTVAVDV